MISRPTKPFKVVPCKFYANGRCFKGNQCTYIHGDDATGIAGGNSVETICCLVGG